MRSKNPTAQKNEVLLKCLVYNVTCLVHGMYELGIEPAFGSPIAAPVSDLTATEQANVRAALRFLRARTGRLDVLAKSLRFERATLRRALAGNDPVGPTMVLRVARLAGVGVDDVLAGRFPPSGNADG